MSTMNREQRRAAAKQAKRQAKAQNKQYQEAVDSMTWDELEESYQLGKDILAAENEMIAAVDKMSDYVENKEYLAEVKQGILSDVDALSKELESIHDSHAGKTGKVGEDDIMDCLDAHMTYSSFVTRATQLLQPQEAALDQLHLLACQEAVRRGGEEANPGPLNLGEVAEAVVAKEE